MNKLLVLCLVLFLTIGTVQGQKIRFKKITKKEIENNRCDFWPEAKVMVLEKLGEISMGVNSNGLIYNYAEGVRIKILNGDESGRGNIKIRYYSPKSSALGYRDKVIDIKGCTYNIEDGKVVTTKLERSDIFRNRLSDQMEEVSFALPGVKAGSVIEYTFVKESNYFLDLPNWYFQEDIPVCYSELTYVIPEYFNFQARTLGNVQRAERKETAANTMIGETSHPGTSVCISVKNVPPVEEEPFVGNLCDLPFRLEFRLLYVDFPDQPIMYFSGNYHQINKLMIDTDAFWRSATRGNFPKELKQEIEGMEEEEKVKYLYDWVKRSVSWNGYYGILSYKNLNEILKERSGSVADINLSLNSLLVQNGIKASPVIFSSRGNGTLHPTYPKNDDFDYVISMVEIGDKVLMCDATSNGEIGLLPVRCLNGEGWRVSPEGGRFVPLKGDKYHNRMVLSDIRFEQAKMRVNIGAVEKDYAALDLLDDYKQGEDKLKETVGSRYAEWDFSNYQIDLKTNEIVHSFDLEKAIAMDEVIYVYPFLYGLSPESPFKRDARKSLVDFPYGYLYNFTTILHLPEGYDIELPENVACALGNKGGAYSLTTFRNGDEVSFLIRVFLKKLEYAPNDYMELKNFFDHLSDLSNTVVVLKKKI